MLSKCANPECNTPFRYLREGKLFQIDVNGTDVRPAGPKLVDKRLPRRIEYFWLCGPCSAILTLVFQSGRGVVAQPLQRPVERAAAAAAVAAS